MMFSTEKGRFSLNKIVSFDDNHIHINFFIPIAQLRDHLQKKERTHSFHFCCKPGTVVHLGLPYELFYLLR